MRSLSCGPRQLYHPVSFFFNPCRIFDVSGNIPVVLAGGTVALVEHLLGYTLQPQAHKSGWNPFQISTQLKKEVRQQPERGEREEKR